MMEVVQGFKHLPRVILHPVLTIGNFDGLHVGHQRIIQQAIQKARALQGQCVAMTFTPHPQSVLRPDLPLPQRITTDEEKRTLFAELGVDLLIEQPFTQDFASISAEEFFETVIDRTIGAEAIVIGYDFGFGKNREGSIRTLTELARHRGIELTLVSAQVLSPENREVISSSRVRDYLLKGELKSANALLGREFSYRGVVVTGDGRGRKIGFPTANLQLVGTGVESKLTLPHGVYVTRAFIEGKEYPSVTNIGIRPTFSSESTYFPLCIECHLLDSNLDLYGQEIEIRFVTRLREERKFAGIAELKAQIVEDIRCAREVLMGSTF